MEAHAPHTRMKISKANSRIMITIAIATAVTVFCLVSVKSLTSQAMYQRKVLHERRVTLDRLQANKSSAATLMTQYKAVFANDDPINIIGGKNDSKATAIPPDGDNARIILDSLPTTYDFPALISSLSSILAGAGVTNQSINGTDESPTANNVPSSNPQPVKIQLSVGGTASYANVQRLIHDFERSTRPFDVTNIQLAGSASSMTFNMQVTTYYQPAKNFSVENKEVR